MILVIIASTDCQPAPIPGLHHAAPDRFRAGFDRTIRSAAGQAPLAGATLSRALPALDRLPPDDCAGARGCLDGDALEVDPAGGDQGRDRLRHPGASLAGRGRGVEPRFAAGIAEGTPVGPGGPGPGRLGAGQALWALEPLAATTRTTKRVQVAVRRKVYEHAMRLPLHRVYQLKSGGASSLLREDAGGVGELIFSMLYNPWQAVVQFLGGVVVLAWVDWRLLLGALFLVPGVYYSDLLWNRRIRPLFRDVRKERQEIDSQTTEVFGGMRVVRAFGRQKSESARFMGQNHFMARLELHVWWLSRLIELLWEFILPMASVALLLYGGMQVIDGRLSLGDLMMFLVYLAMLLEPMAVLATSVTQFQNNLSGFDRVLDLLAEPREMADCPGTRAVSKSAVAGGITLQNVGFIYPGTSRLVLHDIDLEVEPGETIALVGRSGSGKTTLCNLIARFYDPTSGTIALDGADLREIEVESYRRLLGIVEQDVFLFDGTIAENIAYGDRWATRARIEQAAQVANAAEFIDRLPDGYNTLIGERGVRLSGGQRQRLAIARAILADPKIFILDEATSNLDSESERLIQQSLDQLLRGRTSFVIAHRLSTIRHADRILVLDDGAIVEAGSHGELMAGSGLYRDMVELQRIEQGND